MKKLLTFLAVVTLCLAMGGIARADLVVNGDFATGNIADWTFVRAASGSDFFVGAPNPANGFAYAAWFGALYSFDDTLSQSFADTPGAPYTVSFILAHNSTDAQNDFQAYWDGTQLLNLVNAATFGWTAYSFPVVGTGSDTITFAGREDPSWLQLDNVSVDPIPVPPTLVLLGSGLVGLAVRRFRKG